MARQSKIPELSSREIWERFESLTRRVEEIEKRLGLVVWFPKAQEEKRTDECQTK